jgi:asparagine synthase (glutamine-hydrolysing)
MCGIAGVVSLTDAPVLLEEARLMCASLAHRGPDDEGFYQSPQAVLGMRRLSIIDLSTGRQPVANEDGTVWAVFNGEIYNYQELSRELQARGHRFASVSDTEVIVHLYEEHGARAVEHLRGMFAFALWDERRRRLLVARDRIGIKPLYYAETEGRLAFASELKALLQLDIAPRLNWASLGHVLSFLTTPRRESIVEGIHKLEPGHQLWASAEEGVRVERYWDLPVSSERPVGEEEAAEGLREVLAESVRLHMISDVPVGAFLSGGIDSSAVVALMARSSGDAVRTFTIGFTETDYSEVEHARAVARQYGTRHRELCLEPDALEAASDLGWYLDEPFGDPSAIPTYMVSRLAAEEVKVVLSGDGGDELFGGYDKYVVEERERRWDRVPSPLRRALGALGRIAPEKMRGRGWLRHQAFSGAERYLDAWSFFSRKERARLLHPAVRARVEETDPWAEALSSLADRSGGHWLTALQRLDMETYLPLDVLTKVDRMSMAHSLEARVPLLDHKVVEYAFSLPAELKLRPGASKYVFKKALSGLLPPEILHRRKQGFAVPLGRWFRGTSFFADLLLSEHARKREIFDPQAVQDLIRRQEAGRPLDFQLWTLASFELWARRFLDRSPRVRLEETAARPYVTGPAAPAAHGAAR